MPPQRRRTTRLSPDDYAALIARLADRGYLRDIAPAQSWPFADLDPWLAAMDFGFGIPRAFVAPDDYYDLPDSLRAT